MEHAVAMDVIELEALHLRAVDERRVGRGQLLRGAPDRGRARGIERAKGALQDPAPFEVRAIDPATERVEDQELDALAHVIRNLLVGKLRDEAGDLAGVEVVAAGMLRHCWRNLDTEDSAVYSPCTPK